MRSARLPFKHNRDDPHWSTAMLYRAETLRDHFIVRWRRYKKAHGKMWYTLGFGLWEYWYDPKSVESDRAAGEKR